MKSADIAGQGPLVVVYDYGSVAPSRVAIAARSRGLKIVFVVAASQHGRAMNRALRLLGKIMDRSVLDYDDIVRQLRRMQPSGILTFSEAQLTFTARLARDLELLYDDPEVVDHLVSKSSQRKRLASSGVDAIRWRVITDRSEIDDAIAHVGVPAVLKPVEGVSSRNTFVVSAEDTCRMAARRLLGDYGGNDRLIERSVIMEELLVGRPSDSPWADYVGIDCVAHRGDVEPVFITSKFALADPFRERGGYGAASVEDKCVLQEASSLACRAIAALGVENGMAGAEIKFTRDGPRVIEVNGRLGGWVDDLAVRSGSGDPIDVAIMCALGAEIDSRRLNWSGRIAFQYLIVPPRSAHRIKSIFGVESLRRIPNVDRAIVVRREGDSVDWRIGSGTSVAGVLGMCETHDDLAMTVEAIESADWIEYDHRSDETLQYV